MQRKSHSNKVEFFLKVLSDIFKEKVDDLIIELKLKRCIINGVSFWSAIGDKKIYASEVFRTFRALT